MSQKNVKKRRQATTKNDVTKSNRSLSRLVSKKKKRRRKRMLARRTNPCRHPRKFEFRIRLLTPPPHTVNTHTLVLTFILIMHPRIGYNTVLGLLLMPSRSLPLGHDRYTLYTAHLELLRTTTTTWHRILLPHLLLLLRLQRQEHRRHTPMLATLICTIITTKLLQDTWCTNKSRHIHLDDVLPTPEVGHHPFLNTLDGQSLL
mmetsp:Transcript_4825/g.12287  ORF Transcript_4825/g.12287 Transcript_4825/m.12287 type:complete len:203 (-) Transcript_4825:146-754(-)